MVAICALSGLSMLLNPIFKFEQIWIFKFNSLILFVLLTMLESQHARAHRIDCFPHCRHALLPYEIGPVALYRAQAAFPINPGFRHLFWTRFSSCFFASFSASFFQTRCKGTHCRYTDQRYMDASKTATLQWLRLLPCDCWLSSARCRRLPSDICRRSEHSPSRRVRDYGNMLRPYKW